MEDDGTDKELPLLGVVLCCTSILPEHRTRIADMATEMGAVHKFDLTSDVTHLVVGDSNTPKYKYVARERNDAKVVRPEWVEAVRETWVSGGDTDLALLEREYAFPTFAGLSISLTGFEDTDVRNFIQQKVKGNGGRFRRDLTKNATHLIARTAEGQKYKFAIQWGVPVVSIKWLEDSLERGMVLDESLYDPLLPPAQQGVGAWKQSAPSIPEKRSNPSTGATKTRKLRRVASTKLGSQNEGLWSDIIKLNHAESPRSSLQGAPLNSTTAALESEKPSMDPPQEHHTKKNPESLSQFSKPRATGFWNGCIFLVVGFTTAQVRVLERHLLSRDARIVSSPKDLHTDEPNSRKYILVPYNLPRSKFPSLDEFKDELQFVTDFWIERCIHSNSLVPPETHITSTPFPMFPIPEFNGLIICSTGFTGVDLLHLSKLVKLMGAVYDEYFTPKASVLVCKSTTPDREKLRHAIQWKVPAVIADWLWSSVQTAEKKPFEPYLVSNKQSFTNVGSSKPPQTRGISHGPFVEDDDAPPALNEDQFRNTEMTSQSHEDQVPFSERSKREPSAQTTEDGALREVTNLHKVRSCSPIKPPAEPLDQPSTRNSEPPTLDSVVNSLLAKNKQHAAERKIVEEKLPPVPPPRCRRLLGRVTSNSSSITNPAPSKLTAHVPHIVSRASSIDTLNDDGCGSVIESLGSPATKKHLRTPSIASANNRDQPQKPPISRPASVSPEKPTEAQRLLEARLDLFRNHTVLSFDSAELEPEQPPGTQLGYEGPDAAAMRAVVAAHNREKGEAGAEEEEESRKLVIGQLKNGPVFEELARRRRTRRSKARIFGDEDS